MLKKCMSVAGGSLTAGLLSSWYRSTSCLARATSCKYTRAALDHAFVRGNPKNQQARTLMNVDYKCKRYSTHTIPLWEDSTIAPIQVNCPHPRHRLHLQDAAMGLCLLNCTKRSQYSFGASNFGSCRGFKTKSDSTGVQYDSDVEDIIKMLDDKKKGVKIQPYSSEFASGWLVRMANENGYLSWCRNAYLATAVAVTIYIQEPVVPYAKEISFVFFIIGAGNVVGGTWTFIHNIFHLRRRLYMSSLGMLLYYGFAIGHLLLWLFAVILYMGYVEEEREDTTLLEEEERK